MSVSNSDKKKLKIFIINNKKCDRDVFIKLLEAKMRIIAHDKIKDPSKRGHEARDIYCNNLRESLTDILKENGLEI